MPEEIIEERAKTLEQLTLEYPARQEEAQTKVEEKEQKSEKAVSKIPVGSLEERPGWVKVQSKISLQEQWIPPGTKKFRDVISRQVETVS